MRPNPWPIAGRWTADFLAFGEGNVSYIPKTKDEKDDISYQMIGRERYLSFLTLRKGIVNEQVIAIFCIQQKMTTPEIMTFAISPALSHRLSHNAPR